MGLNEQIYPVTCRGLRWGCRLLIYIQLYPLKRSPAQLYSSGGDGTGWDGRQEKSLIGITLKPGCHLCTELGLSRITHQK